MKLELNPNDVRDYLRFLQVKQLPTYRIRGRVAEFPDEYAARLGLAEAVVADKAYKPWPGLFDYQRDISRLAIRKRKFAVFADCGLGKTLIFLEFVRHALRVLPKDRCALIVSPLMVVDQTIAECQKWYGDNLPVEQVRAVDLNAWLASGKGRFGVTNYDALKTEIDPGRLGCLVLDECFPPGTRVACIKNGRIVEKHIENILCGDRIVSAAGIDRVLKTKRKEVSGACAITAGKRIVCSLNHPFFTQRGWVCAQDIRPGDSVLSAVAAMRMVRDGLHAEGHPWGRSVLQSILLSEMADEPAGALREGTYEGDTPEDRCGQIEMAPQRKSEGAQRTETHSRFESDERSESANQGIADSASHEAQTFRAWWQRDRLDATADDLAGCTVRELEGGVCCVAGPATAGISQSLQARLGEQRSQDRHRSGWSLASLPQSDRPKEGRRPGFVRVEGLAILEPGHPELEQFRDADGKLYFYDLEAERHPSYSVAGLLVHNSSMLKSHYGKWGSECIRLGRGLDWKLAGTGTPAPNDRIEYANHAVFLDEYPNVNAFLARFFVNRGQTNERWELKPHALGPFYRALSHWSLFLTNPATYGWKDNVGTMPPIHVDISDVDLTAEQDAAVRRETGQLVATNAGGIGSRQKLARIAKGSHKGVDLPTNKPQAILDLLASFPDESCIIWCKYNDEQDALARLLPDAANIDGSTPHDKRLELIDDFKAGRRKVLVSKPKILGFGLNLQIATRQIFSTLQDSYEEYYQAVKRSNRVGSKRPLTVHIPLTDIERPMVDTVLRKAKRVQLDTDEQERIFKEHSCGLA